MPTVKNVQRQIQRCEGFAVRFLHEGPGPTTGRDVRDDRSGIPGYRYARRSPDCTVGVWIDRRFKATFPGFDVQVLRADGRPADHRMLLSSVRATYD